MYGGSGRERMKQPLGKEFEQVTEFTEFDRPRSVHVHIVEGPYPRDGTWAFEQDGDGTRAQFIAEGELKRLMKLFEPVARLAGARQFARVGRGAEHAPGAAIVM